MTKDRYEERNKLLSEVRLFALVAFLALTSYSHGFKPDNFHSDTLLFLVIGLILVWVVFGVIIATLNFFWPQIFQDTYDLSGEVTRENLMLEEYRQAFETDRHLTSLNWQIATIFVAGVLIGLGDTLSKNSSNQPPYGPAVGIVAFLGISGMIAWYLFVRRNRSISAMAQARAREIERNPDGLVTKWRKASKIGKAEFKDITVTVASPSGFTTVRVFATIFIGALVILLYLAFFSI